MAFFAYLAVFLQQYVVPFIMAIGLIHLVYGIIKYFIIGPSEEPTREEGRQYLTKASVFFLAGLALYLLVLLLTWFVLWMGQFTVDTGSYDGLQKVPDVPTRNN